MASKSTYFSHFYFFLSFNLLFFSLAAITCSSFDLPKFLPPLLPFLSLNTEPIPPFPTPPSLEPIPPPAAPSLEPIPPSRTPPSPQPIPSPQISLSLEPIPPPRTLSSPQPIPPPQIPPSLEPIPPPQTPLSREPILPPRTPLSLEPIPTPRTPPSPQPIPSPQTLPSSSTASEKCPKDVPKIGICAKMLNYDFFKFIRGRLPITLPITPCCTLIEDLADFEAAICICTAIKASPWDIDLNKIPISLSFLLNNCGGKVPPGFQCA